MCFDLDSRPPIPPLAGASIDGQTMHLQASDGTPVLAFDAQASSPTGAGIVVLPDVRGLHHFYEELALRFAERGIDAVAIDYFGRTARTDDRGEKFEYMPHVDRTRYDTLLLDVKSARDHLIERGVESVFAVGFCYGGRLAFLVGSRPELALTGVVGFYGVPAGPGRAGTPAPVDVASQFVSPVLGLFGGADQGIPPGSIDAFRDALTSAGVENELVSYPGAPHSFFDRKAADFGEASNDAWTRVLEFVRRLAQVEGGG